VKTAVILTTEMIEQARALSITVEAQPRITGLHWKFGQLVGPCPKCGGTDRLWVGGKKRTWGCRHCSPRGKQGVIDFVMWLYDCSFREAVIDLVGESPATQQNSASQKRRAPVVSRPALYENNQKIVGEIWRASVPIEGTLAERYLRETRKLILPPDVSPKALRFHPHCYIAGTQYPALISLYRDIVTDKPTAIMRTALKPDGTAIKVNGKTLRMSLGPVGGAAIKLSGAADVMTGLTIGEGLETTLAAMAFGLRPAWTLGSSGAIEKFAVLAGIEVLIILVDNDEPDERGRTAGPEAARACAQRWSAAGREVRLITPNRTGTDIADIFERARASA
jgi:phage/plasmid primase-like uncharacterized protein